MTKYVVCPPCGTVLEGETEEDLVHVSQAHATQKHGYTLPREEVLNAATAERPDGRRN